MKNQCIQKKTENKSLKTENKRNTQKEKKTKHKKGVKNTEKLQKLNRERARARKVIDKVTDHLEPEKEI